MAQPDSPGSVQACAMRLARLSADGSTAAGATNGYVSKDFARITIAPEYQEGEAIVQRDACGGIAVNYKDPDAPLRWTIEVELLKPDPELEELMTGAALLTSTGSRVGNANVTIGSPVVTAWAGAALNSADVGKTVTGTGIAGGSTILSVQSATSFTLSANATATNAGTPLTIAYAAAQSVGSEAPALGTPANPNGISVEFWTKAVAASGRAQVENPWFHWAVPQAVLRQGPKEGSNSAMTHVVSGFCLENPNWGNGPWNDWRQASPSPFTLQRAWGRFRANDFPTPAVGYTAVPTQV